MSPEEFTARLKEQLRMDNEIDALRAECERLKATLKEDASVLDKVLTDRASLRATLAEREAQLLVAFRDFQKQAARIEEYKREVERREEIISGQDVVLREREARITSLQTELNHETGKGDLLREELGEREAEIERLTKESTHWQNNASSERTGGDYARAELREVRAALATARAEALEEASDWLLDQADDGQFDWLAEKIRALASNSGRET